MTKQLLHIADCTDDSSYKQGDDDFVLTQPFDQSRDILRDACPPPVRIKIAKPAVQWGAVASGWNLMWAAA